MLLIRVIVSAGRLAIRWGRTRVDGLPEAAGRSPARPARPRHAGQALHHADACAE
jgi:hypothetical protein